MSAQRRKIARAALLFLAAVPLAIKIPYLWRAWMTSPIDRAHLNLYGVLALVAAGIAVVVLCRRPAREPIKGKGLALAAAALVVFVAGFAVGILRDVNALQLISAVGILWSAAWRGHKAITISHSTIANITCFNISSKITLSSTIKLSIKTGIL